MKYGKIYKFIIIAFGICVVFSVIQKQRSSPGVVRETVDSTKRDENKETSLISREKKIEQTETKEAQIKETTETTEITVEYPDISDMVPEESLSPEIYSPYDDDIQKDCYFTNTENTIDVNGMLPLYAQGTLTEAAQIWFNQNGIESGEIKCLDGTVQRTEEHVVFKGESVNMILVFTYDFDSRTWKIERGSL